MWGNIGELLVAEKYYKLLKQNGEISKEKDRGRRDWEDKYFFCDYDNSFRYSLRSYEDEFPNLFDCPWTFQFNNALQCLSLVFCTKTMKLIKK